MSFDVISIVGLGYIGLPTAAVLATCRQTVVGVDVDSNVVNAINRGEAHIAEPGLDILVSSAVRRGYLRAGAVVEAADAFLIAVPTPFIGEHTPDLQYVEAASRAIAPVLKRGDLVVLESTSPVGTAERIAQWMAEMRTDLSFPQQAGEQSDIRVAYCPERVLPGHAIRELVENDRIIGGMTPRCSKRAAALYRLFVKGECVITDARTAEMCKLAENAFRDVNLAFANELSLICEVLGIDVWALIRLANRHPRVDILRPGPGVGGHCIAVDPWFIVDAAPEHARLIRTARLVNDDKPQHVAARIEQLARRFKAPVIACLGLSFKADVGDLRGSPSVAIVTGLAARGTMCIRVVEPNIRRLPSHLEGKVELRDLHDALEEADIVAILVGHASFACLDPARLRTKTVIDTCGLFSRA
jgi:UDP-N-acetyl-D-mannosaminuronic acid dehydrogenase